jgi:hypothetical protein
MYRGRAEGEMKRENAGGKYRGRDRGIVAGQTI